MKVKMKASMRTLTKKGLALLAKKTKEASKAYEKAFLSPLSAQAQAANILIALKIVPVSEAASEVWDVSDIVAAVYKDALFLLGLELVKTLAREKEYENFDAAAASQEQLDEVLAQLRQLGDQRDLFEEEDDEEEDPRQLSFAGSGKEGE